MSFETCMRLRLMIGKRRRHSDRNRRVNGMSQDRDLNLKPNYLNSFSLGTKICFLFFPCQKLFVQSPQLRKQDNDLFMTLSSLAHIFLVQGLCFLHYFYKVTQVKESYWSSGVKDRRACSSVLCNTVFSIWRHSLWIFISSCSWIMVLRLYWHHFVKVSCFRSHRKGWRSIFWCTIFISVRSWDF